MSKETKISRVVPIITFFMAETTEEEVTEYCGGCEIESQVMYIAEVESVMFPIVHLLTHLPL